MERLKSEVIIKKDANDSKNLKVSFFNIFLAIKTKNTPNRRKIVRIITTFCKNRKYFLAMKPLGEIIFVN